LEIAHLIGYGSHKEVRNHLILSKQITAQSNGWDSFDRIGPRMVRPPFKSYINQAQIRSWPISHAV
ncbi:MAG: hypothetical protein WBB25_05335, partial [Sulfitobacter sp.]